MKRCRKKPNSCVSWKVNPFVSTETFLQVDSYQQDILSVHAALDKKSRCFSFIFLRAGECFIQCNKKTMPFQTGQLSVFPPNQKFRITGTSIRSAVEILTLKPTLLAFFLCSKYVFEETISSSVELNTVFFDNIKQALQKNDPEQNVICSAHVFDFIYNLSQKRQSFHSDKIYSLIQQINSHPEGNYSHNKLKEKYGSDFPALMRLFEKHHKCTIYQYVFQTRMNLAEQLLSRKDCLIQEIARKCGYEDFSFFCREFKRIHGVPPGRFQPSSALNDLAFYGTTPRASAREFRKLVRKNEFCEEFVYIARDWMPLFNQVFPRILHYGESNLKKGYFYEAVAQYWLMEFVKEGQLVFIEKKTGERYFVNAGTFFIIEPGHHYQYEVSEKKNAKICYIGLNNNIVTDLMLSYKNGKPVHMFSNSGETARNFCDEILEIIRTKNIDKKSKLATLTYVFLLSLYPLIMPQKFPKPLNEILYKIQNNISLPLKLKELALETKCSEATLQRLFRKYLKCTPAEYISRVRMNYAENLLRCQDLSISEVAAYCGFRSFALFSKNFRRTHGCTPNLFRKKVLDPEKNYQVNIKWCKYFGSKTVTHEIPED